MLSKKYRLPANIKLVNYKSKDFKAFILKTSKNQLSYPRFAFVISKKVDSKAVVRNRIKREMTMAAGEILKGLDGSDFLFILKRSAVENLENLKNLVEEALLQNNKWKKY